MITEHVVEHMFRDLRNSVRKGVFSPVPTSTVVMHLFASVPRCVGGHQLYNRGQFPKTGGVILSYDFLNSPTTKKCGRYFITATLGDDMNWQLIKIRYFYKPLPFIMSIFCTTSNGRRSVRRRFLYSRPYPYPNVLTIPETVKLLQQGRSLARLGDGEFNLALGKKKICYQKNSPVLKHRMRQILSDPNGSCLIGIPPRPTEMGFFQEYFTRYSRILSFMKLRSTYANANISRHSDFLVSGIPEYRKIWENKTVVFIYASTGRFEIIPEIFSNIKHYHHIDVSAENAFEEYDSVMTQARQYSTDCLFLLACGPAATVFAYDLTALGYQAIDIGHLPNCYANIVSGLPIPEDLPVCKTKSA